MKKKKIILIFKLFFNCNLLFNCAENFKLQKKLNLYYHKTMIVIQVIKQ